jgi:hypothetical protein
MKKISGKKFTAKELAAQFGCSVKATHSHANKLYGPAKNGVTRFFDEAQVTAILEDIKNGKSSGGVAIKGKASVKDNLHSMETELTPVLEMANAVEQIRGGYEKILALKNAEVVRLNRELNVERTLRKERETGLETYQRIAESAGLTMSDRDDIAAMYGRGR